MSGRIFVSITWLKNVHKTATTTTSVMVAGTSRRMRRVQKLLRSMVPVRANSMRSSRVMR